MSDDSDFQKIFFNGFDEQLTMRASNFESNGFFKRKGDESPELFPTLNTELMENNQPFFSNLPQHAFVTLGAEPLQTDSLCSHNHWTALPISSSYIPDDHQSVSKYNYEGAIQQNRMEISSDYFQIYNHDEYYQNQRLVNTIDEEERRECQYNESFTGKISPEEDIYMEPLKTPIKQNLKALKPKDLENTREKAFTEKVKHKGSTSRKRSSSDTKNVVKNYGKAICSFVISDIARPYREKLLESFGVTFDALRDYVLLYKEQIDSIVSFRWMLVADDYDSVEIQNIKKIFRALSEVFVRDFAVNWIITGKSKNKQTLLEFRFRMLRRIQNPDSFCSLKNFKY